MKKVIFRGAGVAIVTPFTADGINFPEFGRLIDDQIAHGTDAIIVAGTTGEAASIKKRSNLRLTGLRKGCR